MSLYFHFNFRYFSLISFCFGLSLVTSKSISDFNCLLVFLSILIAIENVAKHKKKCEKALTINFQLMAIIFVRREYCAWFQSNKYKSCTCHWKVAEDENYIENKTKKKSLIETAVNRRRRLLSFNKRELCPLQMFFSYFFPVLTPFLASINLKMFEK